MTTRREILVASASLPALAWAGVTCAQALAKVRRIGLLTNHSVVSEGDTHRAFRQGLRDLGWIEGKNISIEYRYAEGKSDRLPDFAADLLRLKVDVIVAATTTDALVAQKATRTVPIVIAVAADPVASGLVESLARPGGNITGLSQMSAEVAGKRLELLKEMVPRLSRVAVLWNPQGLASTLNWKELQLPAQRLGIQLQSLEVRNSNDFEKAFEDATRARAEALFILAHPVTTTNLKRIAGFAAKSRLPSIFQWSDFVDDGGLMSYGQDRAEFFRRAATFVDKILKGAKPADLPVEQPTKFEMVINMKTAKMLGITIPQSILVRATRVIE